MGEALPYIIAGVLLGAIVLYAFWLYNQNEDEINVGTWFILAYGDILDLGSYFSMTGKWWLNFVPAAFAIGSISTFFYALGKRRFGTLRWVDKFCIGTDITITATWGYLWASDTTLSVPLGPWLRDFDSATVANLAYQASALIAFVPMWWSQVQKRELEHPAPWLLWGFVFCAFTVVMSYGYEKWEELAYPLINLFTHFMIGATALTVISRLRMRVAPC